MDRPGHRGHGPGQCPRKPGNLNPWENGKCLGQGNRTSEFHWEAKAAQGPCQGKRHRKISGYVDIQPA